MDYCIHYSRRHDIKCYDEVAELIIPYNREDTTLPQFLEKYNDKTIIIDIVAEEDFILNNDIERMKLLYQKYQNIKLRLFYSEVELLDIVKESGIPFFFFDEIDNWDVLHGMLEENPSDICITNDLGFEIRQVAELAHQRGIRVRCYPNIAQSAFKSKVSLKSFFIRPEDVDTYAPYVDVLELLAPMDKLQVYYEIYSHDKKWIGNLDEMIYIGCLNIDNRTIPEVFAQQRVSCGKRCLKGIRPCHICDEIYNLSKTMMDNELYFDYTHKEIN